MCGSSSVPSFNHKVDRRTEDVRESHDSCCNHLPIPCTPFMEGSSGCWINELQSIWKSHQTSAHEVVEYIAIIELSNPRMNSLQCTENHRLDNITSPDAVLPPGVLTCSQCEQGTNTFAFLGAHYEGQCTRYNLIVEDNLMSAEGEGALCVGTKGKVKFCQAREYLAVSHVRAQGWQGTRGDGICSRVLEILLKTAKTGFGVDWVWLDAAMNTSDLDLKLAAKEFNWIYTNAKCTLVCDKALFASKYVSPLERASALLGCEWNTRLWTMTEAMSSKELWVLQQDYCIWSVKDLMSNLIDESRQHIERSWRFYELIRDLSPLICPNEIDGTERSKLQALARVVHGSRQRRARKPLHLFKALFPLFNMEWPSSLKSFEKAHTLFMENLGELGVRSIALFAPFGITGPYDWAPLSFFSTKGVLLSDIQMLSVPPANKRNILSSMWLALKVKLTTNTPYLQRVELVDELPLLDHNISTQRVEFGLEDQTAVHGKAFLSPTKLFPWVPGSDTWLWLLRPSRSYLEEDIQHYVVGRFIAALETDTARVWIMRKVGVVECEINGYTTETAAKIYVTWEELLR